MARGFIGGAVVGTTLAVSVGALASVLAPLPTLSQAPVISNLAPALAAAPSEAVLALAPMPGLVAGAPVSPGLVLGRTPQPDSVHVVFLAALSTAAAPKPSLRQPAAPIVVAAVDVWTLPSQNYAAMDAAEVPRVLTSALTLPAAISDVAAPARPLPLPEASWDTPPLADTKEPVPAPQLARAVESETLGEGPRRLQVRPLPAAAADEVPQTPPAPAEDRALAALQETPIVSDVAETSPGPALSPDAPDVPAAPVITAEAQVLQTIRDDAVTLARAVPALDAPVARVEPPAPVTRPQPQPPAPVLRLTEVPEPQSEDEIVVAQAVPAPVEAPRTAQATQAQSPGAMPAPAVAAPQTAARPSIGKPAVSLTERRGSVVVRRSAITEQTSVAAEVAPVPTPAVDPNAPPITRFSQPFQNPDDKPLMSVVLMDLGAQEIGAGTELAQLRDFPYALSFAVDSTLPDAQERAAMYRAEGFEVLSIIDLPSGARATDVETAMAATLSKMDNVVGVLEGVGTGMQSSRQISDQVSDILAETGHGLVTQAKGLNTMPNLARKVGVPADPIFRDFDSKGQDARVIRRFLDQAAFKAGQEGGVIMLGRLRPETISALLVWGLQDRAGQVALAPISAVLTRSR